MAPLSLFMSTAALLAFLPLAIGEDQCCYASNPYGYLAVVSTGTPTAEAEALCEQYGRILSDSTPRPVFGTCYDECCYKPNGDIHYIGNRSEYINSACLNLFSGTWKACPDDPPLYGTFPTFDGEMSMDPHVKKWNGQWFDYQGECDLVLVTAPEFHNGVGLDVHVRTTIRYGYSFIESAALKLGDEVLQMNSWGQYLLDGVSNAELPATIHGYPIRHTRVNDKQHSLLVQFNEREHIEMSTFKDFVNVKFHVQHLGLSAGLMGDSNGVSLARDGETVLEDPNAFGQEWQVLSSEPELFQTDRLPQAPQHCRLPEPKVESDRLGKTLALAAAKKACADWTQNKKACIHDVMATGDVEIAQVESLLSIH